MTGGSTLPGVDQLLTQQESFTSESFRLETLQSYAGSGEADGIAAFQRGDTEPPPDPDEDEYAAMLRTHTAEGRKHRRVHLVTEPVSDYMAYELCWEYGPHVAAGEDISIVPVRQPSDWPGGVPQVDFFLFDWETLFVQHYADDGLWLGVQHVRDSRRIEQARHVRELVLEHAMPWREYMARHPQLVARLPKGA